jgi:hypothetical protein
MRTEEVLPEILSNSLTKIVYAAPSKKIKSKDINLIKRPKPNFPAYGTIDSDLPLLLRSSKLGSLELLEDS